MDDTTGGQQSSQYCHPCLYAMFVSHHALMILKLGLSNQLMRILNTGSLSIRYVFILPWVIGWTPFLPGRASPLAFTFWLDTKNQHIHPAPSPRVALDQAVCDYTFRIPARVCPEGVAERTIPYDLVERVRSDGACKAHCIDSWESTQFISAGADMSLPGLFCFYWGKKHQQIFHSLSLLKNRNSLFLTGVRLRLHFAWATCPSQLASRLNALRVAVRNFMYRGEAQ